MAEKMGAPEDQQHQQHQAPPPGYSPPAQNANLAPGLQPQPGFQPQQPTVVYLNEVPLVYYGRLPVRVTCPNCHVQVLTELRLKHQCLFMCVSLLCCLIPFCIKGCQKIEHWCPNCDYKLFPIKQQN